MRFYRVVKVNITQEKIPFIKSYLEKKGHIFNTNTELKKFVADMNYYDEQRLDTAYRAYKKRKKDIGNDEKTIGISLRNSAYLSLVARAKAENLSFSDLIEKLTQPEKKPTPPPQQPPEKVEKKPVSMADTLMTMQSMREEQAKQKKQRLAKFEEMLISSGIKLEIAELGGFASYLGSNEEQQDVLNRVFKAEYQKRLDDVCKANGMTKKEFLNFYRLESERAKEFEQLEKWLPESFINSL